MQVQFNLGLIGKSIQEVVSYVASPQLSKLSIHYLHQFGQLKSLQWPHKVAMTLFPLFNGKFKSP